jgi:class 3 adenylate cyclase
MARTLNATCCQARTQFLVTESQGAIPKHVGQLARHHAQVTLMFMDIQGFTAMSKVGKEGKQACS